MADYPYNTARWKRLRLRHLAMHPTCDACSEAGRLTIANTVDHRTPISTGGEPFPSHDGLASLCPSCHSRKTARGPEAGAVRSTRKVQPRKGCDANGNPTDPAHPWNAANIPVENVYKSLRADALETAVPLRNQLVSDGERNGR